MPKGTKVEKVYQALKKQGYGIKSAVKIAQSRTGQSLTTGKPSKTNTAKRAIHKNTPAKNKSDIKYEKTKDIRQRKFAYAARLDRKRF